MLRLSSAVGSLVTLVLVSHLYLCCHYWSLYLSPRLYLLLLPWLSLLPVCPSDSPYNRTCECTVLPLALILSWDKGASMGDWLLYLKIQLNTNKHNNMDRISGFMLELFHLSWVLFVHPHHHHLHMHSIYYYLLMKILKEHTTFNSHSRNIQQLTHTQGTYNI